VWFDIDLSTLIGASVTGILLFAALTDDEGNYDANRTLFFHPYEAFDAGKRVWSTAALANSKPTMIVPIPIIDQKITARFSTGFNDVYVVLSVCGLLYEY